MNIFNPKKAPRNGGSILIFTVIVTAVVGVTMASYLTLVRSQNVANMRSQAWNTTVAVIEAGVEDALTHLNLNGNKTLLKDGWQQSGSLYWIRRNLSPESYYYVTISNYNGPGSLKPVIRSVGHVKLPISVASSSQALLAAAPANVMTSKGFMSRGVRVVAGRDAFTRKAMVAKGQIDFNGNNFGADSFDSSDPTWSTSGLYDPAKTRDNGDVATNSGLVNSVNVGNADIKGRVSTGPGGSVSIGPGGSVGSKAWVEGGSNGIQPGWSSDDMNVDFPNAEAPFTGGAFAPTPGVVNGTAYTFVLNNGNYQIATLNLLGSQKMIVTGHAVLYVPGNVSVSGYAQIRIAPGASLKLYVGGPTANLSGSGIANQAGKAENFQYYGLPGNTSVNLQGNADFTGVIYAPNAHLTLGGGGATGDDFIGASITKSVTLNGSYNFHFDEDLINSGPYRGYTVRQWDEMTPVEVASLRGNSGGSADPEPQEDSDD